jgi:hypothetical protein
MGGGADNGSRTRRNAATERWRASFILATFGEPRPGGIVGFHNHPFFSPSRQSARAYSSGVLPLAFFSAQPGRRAPPTRDVLRSVKEEARDHARQMAHTPEFERSRNERKKVEMLFAHLKTTLRFERMRLRGLSGARDEFLMVAITQNLRRLVRLTTPTAPALA